MTEALEIDREYSLDEFEDVFDTSFGYPVGINYRNPDERQRFIVLLSKEGGPYSDEVTSSETFHYIGEGLEGDQNRTPRNQALIDAVEKSFPIYFFYQYEERSQWEYQGLAEVMEFQRIEKDGRKVFRFTMRRLDMDDYTKYKEAQETVEKQVEEPNLTRETEEVETTRKARSSAFSRRVKEQYDTGVLFVKPSEDHPKAYLKLKPHTTPKRKTGRTRCRTV